MAHLVGSGRVRLRAAELSDEGVLGVVGVLVLIDQHVPEPPPILLAQLGKRLQQVHRGHDQVVEVQRVGRGEPPLILLVRRQVVLLQPRCSPSTGPTRGRPARSCSSRPSS